MQPKKNGLQLESARDRLWGPGLDDPEYADLNVRAISSLARRAPRIYIAELQV